MASVFLFLALTAERDTSSDPWSEDLDFLAETIVASHPLPYARIDERAFQGKLEEVRRSLETGSENGTIAGLMALAASLQDGHTYIDPTGYGDFNRWYPVRFYEFSDGLFITTIAEPHSAYAGAKVIRIGGVEALEVARQAAALWGTENGSGRKEQVILASNAGVLEALGFVAPGGPLSLQVQTGGGETEVIDLASRAGNGGFDWRFYGEMFGPQTEESVDYVTAFDGRAPMAFLDNDPLLPLHLRQRRAYFFEWLPDDDAVYFQFNHVARTYRDTSFEKETQRLFALLDETGADKLIIDIRYNSGGDGSVLPPFVHEIIRRDRLMTPGHLFVLTGRKTFSAAVLLVGQLFRHTPAIFVGEPPSAFINHFGNAEYYTLPNSGLGLSVSAVYHQYTWWSTHPGNDARVFPVDFPVFSTSGEYFRGEDPALALVLGGAELRPIELLLEEEGVAAAREAFAERKEAYGSLPWWRGVREAEMNDAAYELLAEGNTEAAIAGFEMNVEAHPESWNGWDSLGEAYLAADRTDEALAAYERSLSLNPGNHNARMMLDHTDD